MCQQETGGPEKTHWGTGRTCKVHIHRCGLHSSPEPFFLPMQTTISVREYRRYRCSTDKRLSTPVKIRCIKEPSRTKARGSNQNVHHRKTIQGQTPVRMAMCLKTPVDGRWTVWGPPALHGPSVRLRKCDRCIFKMLFPVAVDWTFG